MTKKTQKPEILLLDKPSGEPHTQTVLQLSGNKDGAAAVAESPRDTRPAENNLVDLRLVDLSLADPRPDLSIVDLSHLRRGEAGILDRIELPGEDARRLMEMGFLPGTRITAGLSAPGGDPRVFQVDGSEIALRRETAKFLKVRLDAGTSGNRRKFGKPVNPGKPGRHGTAPRIVT